MKQRTSIRIVACIIVIACANMAGAQWYSPPSQNCGYGSSAYGAGGTTYYNNANGSSTGLSYRTGNTTYYNNANGSSAGSSYRTGNTTYYNNANGSSAGRSTTIGNTTYYYNANGSSAGSSYRTGNTTYYYNANGASAGSATTMGNPRDVGERRRLAVSDQLAPQVLQGHGRNAVGCFHA